MEILNKDILDQLDSKGKPVDFLFCFRCFYLLILKIKRLVMMLAVQTAI